MKFQVFTLIVLLALALCVNCEEKKNEKRGGKRGGKSDERSSEEREFKYPCANKYFKYYLDDEPEEYGVEGGDIEKGVENYVGLVDAGYKITVGKIQLKPAGAKFILNSKSVFTNDSSKIWYLAHGRERKYQWVDSSNGAEVPFAIDYGTDSIGTKVYFGRVKTSNCTSVMGSVVLNTGNIFYTNAKNVVTMKSTGYQVLTCKTCKPEKAIPGPKPTVAVPPPETGCINNWVEYKGDNAPAKNGISAGSYDCGNTAYVGKAEGGGYYIPGRIQITPNTGLYYLAGGKENLRSNGSYYLADNPNYSYNWVNFNGKFPENSVFARSAGSVLLPIARVKINGHMQIGTVVEGNANFPGDNSIADRYTNYEVLVCDPWPKYQCGQVWKKFAGSAADGFDIGIYSDDITSYIGRGTCKGINCCDYELGRIQTSPSTAAGAYYLDDLTATERFDKSTAEYLVKNSKYFYTWAASRNGVKVANALELHKEGHRPFYIGVTQINDNVFIGKVRPGEGLFYVDINGKQKTSSSYNVLTCTSNEAANDVYKEESDESWFGSFGCPIRKVWDFKQWRCVCRDEFKGTFTSAGAKWNEDTCSYSI